MVRCLVIALALQATAVMADAGVMGTIIGGNWNRCGGTRIYRYSSLCPGASLPLCYAVLSRSISLKVLRGVALVGLAHLLFSTVRNRYLIISDLSR